jgi:hypothetical protein
VKCVSEKTSSKTVLKGLYRPQIEALGVRKTRQTHYRLAVVDPEISYSPDCRQGFFSETCIHTLAYLSVPGRMVAACLFTESPRRVLLGNPAGSATAGWERAVDAPRLHASSVAARRGSLAQWCQNPRSILRPSGELGGKRVIPRKECRRAAAALSQTELAVQSGS